MKPFLRIIPDLSKYLPSTSRILVTKPCFLEVLPSDTTKANALEWVCKYAEIFIIWFHLY